MRENIKEGESRPIIEIILPTYNGELYIEDQINSILNQTHNNIVLIIRDDGSTDGTLSILQRFKDKFPNFIKLINDEKGNLGLKKNISLLLSYSEADYIMFCDQDDIWLPKKVELSLQKMKTMELESGKSTPILIHTDLKVVDRNLKNLSSSFWKSYCFDPKSISLNRLLVQNVVTGCTVMSNKSLKSFSCPIPDCAKWHDYWFALVAAAIGKIGEINEPLVLYRQHGKNQIGAHRWPANHIRTFGILGTIRQYKTHLKKLQLQSKAFLDRYSFYLSNKNNEIVKCFSMFGDFGFFKKRYYIIKHKYYQSRLVQNVSLFIFI